jgi:putative sigma-54 modulation protein
MNIAFTFRQMEGSDGLKTHASEKIGRLQRFLRAPMKVQVTLSTQQHRIHHVEAELHSGPERYHATESSEDMYVSIDRVIDKLERQIREQKDAHAAKVKGAERASSRMLPDVAEED